MDGRMDAVAPLGHALVAGDAPTEKRIVYSLLFKQTWLTILVYYVCTLKI